MGEVGFRGIRENERKIAMFDNLSKYQNLDRLDRLVRHSKHPIRYGPNSPTFRNLAVRTIRENVQLKRQLKELSKIGDHKEYPEIKFIIKSKNLADDQKTLNNLVNSISKKFTKLKIPFRIIIKSGSFEVIIQILQTISQNATVAAAVGAGITFVFTKLHGRKNIKKISSNYEAIKQNVVHIHCNDRRKSLKEIYSVKSNRNKVVIEIKDNEGEIYRYQVNSKTGAVDY